MSREIVSQLAYLIGVKDEHLIQFDDIIIEQFKNKKDCSLIRKLCQLRTTLLSEYDSINRELKKVHGRFYAITRYQSLYDSLYNEYGIDIELYSTSAIDYLTKVNKEIEQRIDAIIPLFHITTLKEIWTYIRNLFIISSDDLLEEKKKYIENKSCYPFSCYINWSPTKAGNILENDSKFLTILFSLNGKAYETPKDEMIENIYSFSEKCRQVIIAVDCENIDYIAFYAAINEFKTELIKKIDKIVLFDDSRLKSEWNYYNVTIPAKIEKIDCPRIQKDKSTLDVKLSAYITEAHYRDQIDGFILVSSDSDYWGLIDTIGSTAKFFIIAEKNKISSKNITALDNNKISYCMLDDFYDNETRIKIREETYRNEIKDLLSKTKFSVEYFLEMLRNQTMYLSEEDRSAFRKTACNLIISFDEKGNTIYRFNDEAK